MSLAPFFIFLISPCRFRFLFPLVCLCANGQTRISSLTFVCALLCRSAQRLNYLDCSSEDDESSETEDGSRDFLESFQRSKIKHKLVNKGKGKPRRGSRVQPEDEGPKFQEEVFREFILQNKAPFWNELSQVYQLDFGGRVTQESAKNFQIEHQANQVRTPFASTFVSVLLLDICCVCARFPCLWGEVQTLFRIIRFPCARDCNGLCSRTGHAIWQD